MIDAKDFTYLLLAKRSAHWQRMRIKHKFLPSGQPLTIFSVLAQSYIAKKVKKGGASCFFVTKMGGGDRGGLGASHGQS